MNTIENELKNQRIIHNAFGAGTVQQISNGHIIVCFDSNVEKTFAFPDAFEKFLKVDDVDLQNQLMDLIANKKYVENQIKLEKQQNAERARQEKAINSKRTTHQRKYPKENIAFKCNYCDGGQTKEEIGYQCACSDELIKYNIETAGHSWCCDPENACFRYYNGDISREELDKVVDDGGYVCYESQMLRKWTAFAGFQLKGENKQKPMKLNKVQVNSLAILTSREPYEAEEKRFVFAVFLVDEAYEGDNRDEGYVTTTSKYKLSLSLKEAKSILFWDYYFNENAPDKVAWGQGLHRYISDMQAASILYDIARLKSGSKDEELAQEFLVYFCKINGIEIEELPVKQGALSKR